MIENEFGQEGIDAELVESSREELIQISNGCICCVVRGDFIAAVNRLLESDKKIDYIIIEASGMSEPLPVAQSFLMDSFAGKVHLDSIVCVIDAENFDQSLVVNVPTAIEQLEFADTVIINKYDLANQTKKTQLRSLIQDINPYAPIFETKYGAVDVRTILDTHAFTLTEEKEHEINHHHHNHDNGISEYTFRSEGSFNTEKLEIFIRSLPKEIYRIKGFINLDGLDTTYLLQRAGKRLTIKEYPEKKKTKLVFIGKDLGNYNFEEALKLCLI